MLICVAEDARKKVPSSVGMRRGLETSELLRDELYKNKSSGKLILSKRNGLLEVLFS